MKHLTLLFLLTISLMAFFANQLNKKTTIARSPAFVQIRNEDDDNYILAKNIPATSVNKTNVNLENKKIELEKIIKKEKEIDTLLLKMELEFANTKLYGCQPKDSNLCKKMCNMDVVDGQRVCQEDSFPLIADDGSCVTTIFNCYNETQFELNDQDLQPFFLPENLDEYWRRIRVLEQVGQYKEAIKKCLLNLTPEENQDVCF